MEIIVGGLIEKNKKFLLVKEAKAKCLGKWNFPSGHLEDKEILFDGAKREIFEECGCKVELTGILKIGNRIENDNTVVLIAFSSKLLEENISFNKDEILDCKWFSYEEIIAMKNELREYEWIVSVVEAFVNGNIVNIDTLKNF